MNRELVAIAGGLAGATVGGLLYVLGAATGVALGVAFVAAVAGLLTGRYYDRLPDDDAWPVARWSGAFIAVTMGGTVLALHHGVSLGTETTVALQLFVLATAWNAFVIGAVATEERYRRDPRADSDAPADREGDADGAATGSEPEEGVSTA